MAIRTTLKDPRLLRQWLLENYGEFRVKLQEDEVWGFDRDTGLQTADWILERDFPGDIQAKGTGYDYQPAFTSVVRASLMATIQAMAQDRQSLKDFEFWDLGCGKGKVVWMARHLVPSMKAHRGIDHHPEVVKIARHNVRGLRGTEILEGDVLALKPFAPKVVIFTYNPFNFDLMEEMVKRVQRQCEQVYWVYNLPRHDSIFLKWRLRVEGTGPFPPQQWKLYSWPA